MSIASLQPSYALPAVLVQDSVALARFVLNPEHRDIMRDSSFCGLAPSGPFFSDPGRNAKPGRSPMGVNVLLGRSKRRWTEDSCSFEVQIINIC
jgi:hypothetical protein